MGNEKLFEHLTGKEEFKKLPSWLKSSLIILVVGTPTTFLYAEKLVAFLAKDSIEKALDPVNKKITILESVVLDSYRLAKKQDKMLSEYLNSVGQEAVVKKAESEMRSEAEIDSVGRLLNKKPEIFLEK